MVLEKHIWIEGFLFIFSSLCAFCCIFWSGRLMLSLRLISDWISLKWRDTKSHDEWDTGVCVSIRSQCSISICSGSLSVWVVSVCSTSIFASCLLDLIVVCVMKKVWWGVLSVCMNLLVSSKCAGPSWPSYRSNHTGICTEVFLIQACGQRLRLPAHLTPSAVCLWITDVPWVNWSVLSASSMK